jgi:transposase-like protein
VPRQGPPYSLQFRADAVRRLRSGGTTVAELSRELGVSEQTLRRWRRQAAGVGPSTGERDGLRTALREPVRPLAFTPASHEAAVTTRRRELRPRGKAQSVRRFAGLAAETIEVGIALVTLPARWAVGALRRYADQ